MTDGSAPRELLDITGQPLNPTTVERLNVNDDEGCPVMSSDLVTVVFWFLTSNRKELKNLF